MAQSKERQIASQSSLKLVNEWAISCNQCLTLKELISITNVVVDYVENGYSKEIGERLSTIDNYLDNEKQYLLSMKDEKIEFFTKKLNSLRIKQATFTSSGYKTPMYLEKDIRLTEIALKKLNEGN